MNLIGHFAARQGRTVQTAIVGTGGFGSSFLAQARRVDGLACRVAVDRDAAKAAAALASVGVDPVRIAVCDDAASARAAWEAGDWIAAGDLATVASLPLDVVLEATGDPEAGARHAEMAIAAGHHVVMVTKETDSVVGPILSRMARDRGVVVAPVDGDQPSLLIGLATWAQVIGLQIIAAGKSSEYDFVFDPDTGQVISNGRAIAAPDLSAWLDPADRPWAAVAAGRGRALRALPQRAVPDLCELTLVANALGFSPDRADLHAPIARIPEVADLMTDQGGLLSGQGRLDVFHCLRLPKEVSFAGGVFVTVACDDAETWDMLRDKGHVVSRDGRTAMVGLPRHLLGLEAATTVFEAALHGVSSGARNPRPVVDLTAFADADLPAGTVLRAEGHHHTIAHVSGRMTPAARIADDAPVPYYLAAGRALRRDVAAGQPILCADVALDEGSALLRLRRQQDTITDWGAGSGA
ncbi:SAF domain-containing protein [Paracoccus sediminilitoris]|uniref:SAF domain-containing protein n=1 Tax=Paracoccus sediminilitoris TaxID=2202419 RepID=UPI000DBAC0DD|nr:SAF domain-containing protein [Paracoccus sediminilitoris]